MHEPESDPPYPNPPHPKTPWWLMSEREREMVNERFSIETPSSQPNRLWQIALPHFSAIWPSIIIKGLLEIIINGNVESTLRRRSKPL